MKKKRGKINSNKRLSKSNSFFKTFLPVLLVVIALLLGIILFNTINPTGNAITEDSPENTPNLEMVPAPSEISTAPENTPNLEMVPDPRETSNFLDSFSFEDTPLWIKISVGIVILLILIAIIFLIKKLVRK